MQPHLTIKTRDGELAHVVGDCTACAFGHHAECYKLLRPSEPLSSAAWFNAPPDLARAIGPALYACRCYAFGQCRPKPRWRWFGWIRREKDWRIEK